MSEVRFSPGSWTLNGRKVGASGEAIATATDRFLPDVSDVSVFGTNDVLGGLASTIYGAMVERVGGCLDTLADGYTDCGRGMVDTGGDYAGVEAAAVRAVEALREVL